MNHKTVLEFTRSMLHDLKNIEKVFIKKSNEKARAKQGRPRLAEPPRKVDMCPRNMEGKAILEDQPPRRCTPPSTANGARRLVGPLACTTPVSGTGLTRTAKR